MSASPTVYADESSSTGENLLDPNQPVFCAAGVHISSGLAAQIIQDVRSQLPATHGEPKYISLAKTDKGREALLSAFASLDGEIIRAYPAHKRFMVVGKMVDMLMEQFAHENGYDMYADGSALGLANLIHMTGPVMADADAYEKVLATFVDAVRMRSRASVDDLFAAISVYKGTADPQWVDIVQLLELARDQADDVVELVASGEMRDALDPAIPCLVVLCDDMGAALGKFSLVHDNSNTLARNALQLLNLHEMSDPLRPGSTMQPLPISDISFSDSATTPQLHIADWVAGAVRQWATSKVTGKADRFSDRLEQVVTPWLIGALWPDPDTITTPRPPRPRGR